MDQSDKAVDASASFKTDMSNLELCHVKKSNAKDHKYGDAAQKCVPEKDWELWSTLIFLFYCKYTVLYNKIPHYWGTLYCEIQISRFFYIFFDPYLAVGTETEMALQSDLLPRKSQVMLRNIFKWTQARHQQGMFHVTQAISHMRQQTQNPGNAIPRLPGEKNIIPLWKRPADMPSSSYLRNLSL